MKNEKIKEIYNKKIEDLIRYNYFYYEKNAPKIKDSEYDKLRKEIISLEKKYRFLNSKNSPNKIVGFKPSKIFRLNLILHATLNHWTSHKIIMPVSVKQG